VADGGGARGERVVDDEVAARGEADDDHQVPGGAVAGAGQLGGVEGHGDRRRDAGFDELFEVVDVSQLHDFGVQPEVGGPLSAAERARGHAGVPDARR